MRVRLNHQRLMKLAKHMLMAVLTMALSSCMTTQGHFTPLGGPLQPKPPGTEVQVYRIGLPARPFTRVARLDAHIEKTHLIPPSFAEARRVLEEQARLAGADAVIEVQEKRSFVGETLTYHVTGIRYR